MTSLRRLSSLIALALLAVLLFVGCGSSSHSASSSTTPAPPASAQPFVCHPKAPPQLGECIRQELESRSIAPAAPKLSATFGLTAGVQQGIDISRWQPHPDFRALFREGIRFVIVQGADNAHESNPFFDSQVRSAHEAGMLVGVYIFAEGDSSSAQANALIAAAAPERSRIVLGAYVDAEVDSAYPRACGVAAALARSFPHVGVYGSPGTYRGGRCTGGVWGACWGGGPPCALPGYPFSAIVLRQWCGTCRLGGNDGEIDRDEDRGAIALSHAKPKPISRAQRKLELDGKYRKRAGERAFLQAHHCRQPPWHAAKPAHYEHACHVELRSGAATNASIALYHAKFHVF